MKRNWVKLFLTKCLKFHGLIQLVYAYLIELCDTVEFSKHTYLYILQKYKYYQLTVAENVSPLWRNNLFYNMLKIEWHGDFNASINIDKYTMEKFKLQALSYILDFDY